MKTTFIYTALIFILNLSFVNAQKVACDCKAELDFYYQESQNLISFKDQFKKKDKVAYQNLYQNLTSEITGSESPVECLQIISQLAAQIKDEHASLRMKGFDIEKYCWMAVHEHKHGVLPSEYDIREIDEDLYLELLQEFKHNI